MVTLDSLVKKLSKDIEKGKVVSYSITNLEDNAIYEDYRYLPYNIKKKLEKLLPVTLGDVKAFLSISHVKNYLILVDVEKEEKLAVVIVFQYPAQKEVYKKYMKLLTGEYPEAEQEEIPMVEKHPELSALENDLEEVSKEIKSAKSELEDVKTKVSVIDKEVNAFVKQARQNTNSIDELYNKYNYITTILVNLQSVVEDISKTVTKTKKNVEKIQSKISKLEKLLND